MKLKPCKAPVLHNRTLFQRWLNWCLTAPPGLHVFVYGIQGERAPLRVALTPGYLLNAPPVLLDRSSAAGAKK